MRALGLSLAFVAWFIGYTAFALWLNAVITGHEQRPLCASASPSLLAR
jgi:hypothetical protein